MLQPDFASEESALRRGDQLGGSNYRSTIEVPQRISSFQCIEGLTLTPPVDSCDRVDGVLKLGKLEDLLCVADRLKSIFGNVVP